MKLKNANFIIREYTKQMYPYALYELHLEQEPTFQLIKSYEWSLKSFNWCYRIFQIVCDQESPKIWTSPGLQGHSMDFHIVPLELLRKKAGMLVMRKLAK